MCIFDTGVILWYTIGLIMTNQAHWPQWQTPGTSVEVSSCNFSFHERREHYQEIPNNRDCCQLHTGMPFKSCRLFVTKSFLYRVSVCVCVCKRPQAVITHSRLLHSQPFRSGVCPEHKQQTVISCVCTLVGTLSSLQRSTSQTVWLVPVSCRCDTHPWTKSFTFLYFMSVCQYYKEEGNVESCCYTAITRRWVIFSLPLVSKQRPNSTQKHSWNQPGRLTVLICSDERSK